MAFKAENLLQLIVLVTWTCLVATPVYSKNALFATFFTSEEVLHSIASAASLTFCPGLFEVLQAATPPTVTWFKQLPTCDSIPIWAVYVITLEKDGCRPMIYIGSGTEHLRGVRARFNQYDLGAALPSGIIWAQANGYIIVHKGILCWIPVPSAMWVPLWRLLFYGMEAAFAFMLWAMQPHNADYGMGHLCLWDRKTMEYDGLCSHSALKDAVQGEFDLTPEQLEALAAEKEKNRAENKIQNATNYHYKQMAENYDEYITNANARSTKSRADNPGQDAEAQRRRAQKAKDNKSHHCDPCNHSYSTKAHLDNHLKTAKHAREVKEATLKRPNKIAGYFQAVAAAAQSSSKLD